MPLELLRIVAGWDRERDANPWLEARRQTSEGEELVKQEEFQGTGAHASGDASSRLACQLKDEGWKVSTVGGVGQITMMTRDIPWLK